jgi:SAM-dependent methyltransferase
VFALDASLGMMAETQRQAQQTQLNVYALQARAEALPLHTAWLDRLLANHMLYHVGDQAAALAEMHRVLKPGGVVLLATNAADSGDVLYLAHCAAAQSLGYTPAPRVTSRFHLGHLATVQQAFPDAAVHVYHDAFLFPSLDAALRYYLSGIVDLIEGASPTEITPANCCRQCANSCKAELTVKVACAYLKTRVVLSPESGRILRHDRYT